MKQLTRLLVFLLLNQLMALPVSARVVEQTELRFKIKSQELLAGEIHYAHQLYSPKDIVERFPEAIDLDSMNLIYEKGIKILITKMAFIVNKPVGFFTTDLMRDPKFLQTILGAAEIKKVTDDIHQIKVPEDKQYSYQVKSFFDSDDISTLNNSKVVQAVTAVKKLDVISQGASAHVVREFSKFTQPVLGSTQVSSYIPLMDGKTLVILYQFTLMKKKDVKKAQLRTSIKEEATHLKPLIDQFELK